MTDEKALTARPDDLSLEAYGDLAQVREMTKRLLAMLPSAKDLGPAGAGALAQTSLAMGLNPFVGEVWAIPQSGGTYAIMVGIKGLRAKAHAQARQDNGYYTVHIRSVREDEIEGMQINPGDIVRACDLYVSGDRARRHFEFIGKVLPFTGIGVYRSGERTKMNPLQVARKRAEAEAIKMAFDVPLSFALGASADIELDDTPERYEEHGDGLVNGNANTAIDELYGEYIDAAVHNGQMVEGDPFLETDNPEDTRPPAAARSWPVAMVQAVMGAGIASPERNVSAMLNLSHILSTTDEVDLVLAWSRHYRTARDGGKEPGASAEFADDQIKEVAAAA